METLLKYLDNVLFTFSMAMRMIEKSQTSIEKNEEYNRLASAFIDETKKHLRRLIRKKNGMSLITLMCLGGNLKITDLNLIPKIKELEECFGACEKHGLLSLIKEVNNKSALFTL